ncbi:MAG: GerMN domain-containing protein, partial [Acidimicrobiia bacterium]|nr:GerMN domain-containing protein [Acidimicrobiia bacterium]
LMLIVSACGTSAEPTDSTTTSTVAETTTTTVQNSTTTTPDTTTPADSQTVTIYFAAGDASDCSLVQGFERAVPATADPITAAFEALVGGPDPTETSAGAGSFFSSATTGSVRSVDLTDGLLKIEFVDFRNEISNASTSCGSASLVASLNATAFEFDEVERVRYTIFGSCNNFYNWLQGECQDQTRTGPVAVDLNVMDEALGSGCTPGAEQLPDGDWFGYVGSATSAHIEFDLACWFSGTPAAEAAAEDGQESPPPNDYYIRNTSPETRTVAVSDAVEVSKLVDTGGAELEAISYDDWASGWDGRFYQPGVWITIDGGTIVDITEQYVP